MIRREAWLKSSLSLCLTLCRILSMHMSMVHYYSTQNKVFRLELSKLHRSKHSFALTLTLIWTTTPRLQLLRFRLTTQSDHQLNFFWKNCTTEFYKLQVYTFKFIKLMAPDVVHSQRNLLSLFQDQNLVKYWSHGPQVYSKFHRYDSIKQGILLGSHSRGSTVVHISFSMNDGALTSPLVSKNLLTSLNVTFKTHWIQLHNINSAYLCTGPLLKFNGNVY